MTHMNGRMQVAWQFLVKYFHALWKFFAGGVLVLGAVATLTDLKTADVTIEIMSVATASSEPIDLMRVSDVSHVREFIAMGAGYFSAMDVGTAPPAMSVEEIDRQMQIGTNRINMRRDELNTLIQKLEEATSMTNGDREAVLDSIEEENPFVPAIVLQRDEPEDARRRTPMSARQRIDASVERIRSNIAQRKKYLQSTMAKMVLAEKEWTAYKDKILPNKAKLIITCAIGNRGSGATALKPQGILRANLGDGHYLDLPMKLSGYETSQDLGVMAPHSFKIVRLQSDEVQSMTSADRQRYTLFLGNISPATVYMTDVNNNVFASNSVPFAPGVYEQKVFDNLKHFATGATHK